MSRTDKSFWLSILFTVSAWYGLKALVPWVASAMAAAGGML